MQKLVEHIVAERPRTVVLRAIPRAQAKNEILKLFKSAKETLFYSDVAEQLSLDLELVVELCHELETEGQIGVLNQVEAKRPKPGFPFCPPDQGLCTPTRLSARQISSSHVVPLPAEAALDVEPTRAPAFRAVLRHRSTLVPFLRQAASLHSSRVSLPGQVAPRSSAACRRTAAGSDALPPGGASSTLRASPAGPRSSPAAAGDS